VRGFNAAIAKVSLCGVFGPILAVLLVSVQLAGCAGVEVTPVPDDRADQHATGFRYYQPAPYLLVYSDNKGGLASKLIFLPDLANKMSIRPYNYLSSSNVQLSFDNGMLVSSESQVDETILPKAVIAAAEKAAMAMAAGNVPTGQAKAIPAPYLFKIVIAKDSVTLVGDQGSPTTISFGKVQ
jgi:hypothetical protein